MKQPLFISAVFRRRLLVAALCSCAFVALSCNPFAPAIENNPLNSSSLLSDQMTVEGVFQNFRYAYTFKDTAIYGRLLDQRFIFSYRDYDKMLDDSWGRDDEMRITMSLFQNASNLNLVWNEIVGYSGDSLRTIVTRSFNLTVTFSPSDILRVDGKATLDLQRESGLLSWKIVTWRDESNF
jgi:hypothetical protein